MYKNFFYVLAAISLVFASCGPKDKKTKDGEVVRFYTDKSNSEVKDSDIIEFGVIIQFKDSTLMNTHKQPQMGDVKPGHVMDILLKDKFGPLYEAIKLMSEGDSATIFHVMKDSMELMMMRMPNAKLGDTVKYTIDISKAETFANYKKRMEEESKKQLEVDDKALQDFFKKNNLAPTKMKCGVYFTVQTKGTGAKPNPGQTVSVKYTGKLFDGTVFDSNVDPKVAKTTNPLEFPVGFNMVIPGWDKAFLELNKGDKVTLYIPSSMAYGKNGFDKIPANSNLIFEVEFLDIKETKMPEGQQMPPQK